MLSASIENPVLLIKAKHIKDQIIVEITDNGPGMPIEIQEKIFQPNFTTKKDGLSFGLGLGLSIVLKLIDNYNGTIEVNSKVGKTTFTIKIPIA